MIEYMSIVLPNNVEMYENALNNYGADGWELVSVYVTVTVTHAGLVRNNFVFKRPSRAIDGATRGYLPVHGLITIPNRLV